MKRLLSISCFLILLCSSVSIFSAEIFTELAEVTEEGLVEALGEAAAETLGEAAIEGMVEAGNEAIADMAKTAENLGANMAEVGEDVAANIAETMTNSLVSSVGDDAAGFASKFASEGADAAANLTNDLTKTSVTEFADSLGETISTEAKTTLVDTFTSAEEDFGDAASGAGDAAAESGTNAASSTTEAGANAAGEAGAESGTKAAESTTEAGTKAASSTTEAGANAASDAAKAGGETTKTLAQKVGSFFAEASKMIVTSVLMMVPSSIMTAIVAENTRNAMLATVATPVKWGTGVYQIPSCFINTQVPADSLYVYVRLPLASTTQAISSDMALAFPGLSGAGTNGAPGGDDITADYTVVGDTSTSSLKRYLLSPTFLQSASWTCTYPTGSAVSNWATTYINSTTAPGQIIDLNTGYVSVADGTDGGNSPVQLVGSTTSVLNGITDLYGDVQDISSTYTFTQYDELNATLTGDAADTGSDSVVDRLFNCACIDGTNADYSNVTAACQTTDATPLATCLLSSSIATLGAGTVIAADGTETDNWDLLEGSALTDSELAGTAQTTSSTGAADTSVTSVITQILNVATPVVTALITAGISSSSTPAKAGASGAAASTTATKTAAA